VTSATEGRTQGPGEELDVLSPTVDDGGLRVASGPGREPLDGIEVRLLRLDPDLPPPSYAHPGDAGADLRTREDVTLQPGQRRVVPTGVAVALPEGFVGLVHPRSGLAAWHGLTVVNAPGTVDAGYRGEIMVTLLNTDCSEPVVLRRGDRIAQFVVQRVERACFIEVETLPESVRGAGGFGSTGGFTGFAATGGPDTPVAPAGHAQHEAGDSPGRGESS
jgi:dUTP pyrophosphatase